MVITVLYLWHEIWIRIDGKTNQYRIFPDRKRRDMHKQFYIIGGLFILIPALLKAGEKVIGLTLPETVERAQAYSPDARSARHTFRAAYWNYRSYLANYLPAVSLTSTPALNRTISRVTLSDGTEKFVERNQLITDLSLGITQNVALTGGYFFLETSAERLDLFNNKTTSWQSVPLNFGYSQSLFGYNSLKWSRRIEPVRYRESKKAYVETLELVASRATDRFFALAKAQSNYEVALFNYANADTLYRYARGRYEIGTITENEMLQLEVNMLTEETHCMNARTEVDDCMQSLRSYLGITEDVELRVQVEGEVPAVLVELEEMLEMALANSPDMETLIRRKLESESAVAQARASAGLKADIYMRFGLTQTADHFRDLYRDPLNQQYVSLSLAVPLLDWGRSKGKIRVALSNRDLVYNQIEQSETDFALNVRKVVNQFNLQARRVEIARKTDMTATRRHDVARRLYLLGESSLLDLNAAISEKDTACRNYISALHTYWSLYYTLRSITLYDFEKKIPVTEDYSLLLKQL